MDNIASCYIARRCLCMSRFESVLILKLDDYKLYFLNHDVVLCAVLYFSPAAVPAGKVTEGLAESNVSLPPGG